uniref:Uncharacterized protein n=1 Tax=Arundo donax TaxID=35708 RepID=A0A0A9DKU5_ARUDO
MFFQALSNPVSGPAQFPSTPGGGWVLRVAVVGSPFAREIRLLNAERLVAHWDADHMLMPCLLHLSCSVRG